jgi:hypothetical protein
MRRVLSAAVVVVTATELFASSAAATDLSDAVASSELTPDQFLDAFDEGVLPGLGGIGPAPSITGNADLDARIRAIGEQRGYRRRPLPDRELVSVGGFRLQPEAAAAWRSLQAAANEAGHPLRVFSAFRSVESQVSIFLGKLRGTSDAAIDERLQVSAVPGYSRHHTGYAIDISASGIGDFAIRDTASYGWLAENNFANAKAHGWVPSYPDGSRATGPNPEPWEYVWVGATNIICASFVATDELPFCDSLGSTFEADIAWLHDAGITKGCRDRRFCADTEITRGEAATMLWRSAGEPTSEATIVFSDVPAGAFFSEPVRWMVDNDITTGTTPRTFSPNRPLTRAEFVTFLWRLADRPPATGPSLVFSDVAETSFAQPAVAWAAELGVTRGTSPSLFTPNRAVTRGETAAFLHRFALTSGG